jgi:predicted dehydrogenase
MNQVKLGKPLTAGLVGLGHRGKKHLKILLNEELVDLQWVYDPGSVDVGDLPCKRLKHTEEFSDNPVDFVVVSVPHHEYLDTINKLALGCTKYILKEKPGASSIQEAYALKHLEANYGINICVASQRRFSKSVQYIKKMLEHHGPPLDFSYKYYLGLTFEDLNLNDWRERKDLAGGGAIMDMGYHAIDLMTYLLGVPKDITCYLRKPVKEAKVESGGFINFTYDHTYGSIYMERFLAPKEEELSLHWREFSLKLLNNKLFLAKNGISRLIEEDSSHSMLVLQLKEFIKYIMGQENYACDLSSSIHTIETIQRSYWNSKWLSSGDVLKDKVIN